MNVQSKYFIYGFSFGLCFPIMAIGLQMVLSKLSFSVSNVFLAHKHNSLIYMIDTAPIFLGLFAWIGGISKQKSLVLLNEFKLLSENLSQSNNHFKAHSEFIFSEFMKSSKDIEDITQNLIESNETLYQKNSENKSAAENLDFSTHVLLSSTNKLITLNRELKASNDKTFVEVKEFKTMIDQLSQNYSKTMELGNEIKTLSINSSIEASRYGESGKSFAVIARHIKTLSEYINELNVNTQDITRSVNYKISEISESVDEQNKKLHSILNIVEDVESKTNTNKNNLANITQNIENSIYIQDLQKDKFQNVNSEIEKLSRKKYDLIEHFKIILENNSNLITRISKL